MYMRFVYMITGGNNLNLKKIFMKFGPDLDESARGVGRRESGIGVDQGVTRARREG